LDTWPTNVTVTLIVFLTWSILIGYKLLGYDENALNVVSCASFVINVFYVVSLSEF